MLTVIPRYKDIGQSGGVSMNKYLYGIFMCYNLMRTYPSTTKSQREKGVLGNVLQEGTNVKEERDQGV